MSRQQFLIVRLSSVGDIVHALPAVAALGESFPEAEITWAVESRYSLLLEGNPYLRRILRLDTLGWRRHWVSRQTWCELSAARHELRDTPFDAAIDFQGLIKSALIARVSRAVRRLGLASPWLREPAAAVLYTERVAADGRQHAIEEGLALVERLGARPSAWRFPLPRDDWAESAIAERLRRAEASRFILISPGGGWIAKRWPPSSYAALIRALEGELDAKFVLTGAPAEADLIAEILSRAGSRRAAYVPSSLAELIPLARRACLFLGGDTGPLHIAAALATPIVAIYGPTSAARNGPFSPADVVLSNGGPIDHTRSAKQYLQGVSVDAVRAAIHQRLEVARA